MKITLQRNWNAPGDRLFFSRNSPMEVDDDLLPYLPSDTIMYNTDGKPFSRDETRTKVLLKRRELELDKPTADLPASRRTSDEDLLANAKSGKKPPVMPGTTSAPNAPSDKLDRGATESALKSATQRLASASKALELAKTEPDKGEAKVEIEKARKDIDMLQARLDEDE